MPRQPWAYQPTPHATSALIVGHISSHNSHDNGTIQPEAEAMAARSASTRHAVQASASGLFMPLTEKKSPKASDIHK